jgi:hypothetical protein
LTFSGKCVKLYIWIYKTALLTPFGGPAGLWLENKCPDAHFNRQEEGAVLTETEDAPTATADIEEVCYPPGALAELAKIIAEAEADIASGELVPMTFEEFEAECLRIEDEAEDDS